MNKSVRASLAQDTVVICEAGQYVTCENRTIEIGKSIEFARSGTRLHSPGDLPVPPANRRSFDSQRIKVTAESTMSALQRLTSEPDRHVAGLNFASAKHPGGRFLEGAEAQEEALARSSALYPCLITQPSYYERNRASHSARYLDLAIYSPKVPFFRDDDGTLLGQPYLASIITSPAPHAGDIARDEPDAMSIVPAVFRHRAEFVLNLALAYGVTHLVLGAWGCGIFRNDPKMVARVFANLLTMNDVYSSSFEEVTFAIYDSTPEQTVLTAFQEHIPCS